MHSKIFVRLLTLATLTALGANAAFAEGPGGVPPTTKTGKDVVGAAKIAARIEDLRTENAKLATELQAVKDDKTILSNIARRDKMRALKEQIRTNESEMEFQQSRNVDAGRKFGKIERDEDSVEALKDEQRALLKSMEGVTDPDKIAEIQLQLQEKTKEIKSLEARVKRKEKAYERRTGVAAPVRCKAPLVRDPKTNTCVEKTEKVVKAVQPDSEELKKRAECWVRDEKPYTTTLSTTFPLGEDGLIGKDGSGTANSRVGKTAANNGFDFQHQVSDLFDQKVGEFYKENGATSVVRFYKVEVSSHASRVGVKSTSPTALANARSEGAVNAFFASLALNQNVVARPVSDDFEVTKKEFTATNPVELGPKWTPGDQARMKRAPTPEEVRKVAVDMVANRGTDNNPVLVPGDVEATVKNLNECCARSLYSLRYQPYQYSTLKIYGERFSPETEACAATWNKVTVKTGEKALVAEPVTDHGEEPKKSDVSNSGN